MKLTTQALQPAGVLGHGFIGEGIGKVDMGARQALDLQIPRQAIKQFESVCGTGSQYARPTDRAERHGRQQLGVIVDAGALAGVGPTMIEHVLAIRMPFAITRQCRHQPVAFPVQQVLRLPARMRADAGAVFQRTQKPMLHKRLGLWHQGIPRVRSDIGQAVQALQRHRHPHCFLA